MQTILIATTVFSLATACVAMDNQADRYEQLFNPSPALPQEYQNAAITPSIQAPVQPLTNEETQQKVEQVKAHIISISEMFMHGGNCNTITTEVFGTHSKNINDLKGIFVLLKDRVPESDKNFFAPLLANASEQLTVIEGIINDGSNSTEITIARFYDGIEACKAIHHLFSNR